MAVSRRFATPPHVWGEPIQRTIHLVRGDMFIHQIMAAPTADRPERQIAFHVKVDFLRYKASHAARRSGPVCRGRGRTSAALTITNEQRNVDS